MKISIGKVEYAVRIRFGETTRIIMTRTKTERREA